MTILIQQRNIMVFNIKIKRLVSVLFFAGISFVKAQNFNVTSNLLGNLSGRFDYELAQALTFLQTNPSATIRLNVPNGNLIQLANNIAPIVVPNGKTLRIIKHPNSLTDQGFDMTYYSLMPFSSNACGATPGFCWTTPLYGLSFINSAGATVSIEEIKFYNFNKTWYTFLTTWSSYIVNNLGITNFPQFFNQPCSGGPPCIIATEMDNFTVKKCKFENYTLGIHYSRIKLVTIKDNIFTTDASYGSSCNFLGGADAIMYKDITPNTFLVDATIVTNTILANPNTLDYPGTGIVINPCNWPFTSNLQSNIDANIKLEINNNEIKNCSSGILQFPMHPDRTTPDNTYNINIHDNIFLNAGTNVLLGGPYRHFKLDWNNFGLKSSYPTPLFGNENPAYFGLGTFSLSIGSQYLLPIRTQVGNAFGFKMIYANSLGMALANQNNTFNFINNSQYTWDPIIFTDNDFKKEVDFIGPINFNGFFEIGSGKNTNIRESKNTLNGREIGNPPMNTNIVFVNPVVHSNNFVTMPIGQPPNLPKDPSNGNLAAPTLKSAQVDNNKLKIAFDLVGNNITPINGPYVVEFYRSNLKGELVTFLGRQTINTLTGFTYSLTIIPPASLNPPLNIQGERIGVTLTSLGTNNNPVAPLGTSSVSYIYSLPCNDCISDFAPVPGKEYLASSWVKLNLQANTFVAGYSGLAYQVIFYSATIPTTIQIGSPIVFGSMGSFVDGWQKLEGKFAVPQNAVAMRVDLINNAGGAAAYFDDIRIFPIDATMKSYAYDPSNMRLMSELDENNYATFYEYDEEGKLIRVKKETEKGIMTIKESRNNKPTK